MNRSKIRDPRWWQRWRSAGALASLSTPTPCNPAIFRDGRSVAAIAQGSGARSWHIEALIRAVATRSGTRGQTDWHYSGGIAQVLTLGNADAVAEALRALWPGFLRQWPESWIRIGGPALYRAGDPLPDGVIGVDSASAMIGEGVPS